MCPDVYFHLTHQLEDDYSIKLFSALNNKQVQCVISYLNYQIQEKEGYYKEFGVKSKKKRDEYYKEIEDSIAIWKTKMKKPITLHIPDYYNQKNIDGNCIKLSKTEPQSKEDNTKAMFLASIEKNKNYQCKLQCISDKDRGIITNNFKSAHLHLKVADCETYALNWHHFIIRWIAISEEYVLQLLIVVTKPEYLIYHTAYFSSDFYKTVIDKNYDYSNISDIENVFDIEFSKE